MDAETPGIQSSVSVNSGVPFSVGVFYVSIEPLNFDRVGVDISFNKDTDTGSLTQFGPFFAGDLAGFPAESFDGSPVFPGVPLFPMFIFPPAPGFSETVGPAGYYDPTGISSFGFGGTGLFLPPGGTVQLMTVEFTISGSLGQTATLLPSGILDPLVPSGDFIPGPQNFIPFGEAVFDGSGSPVPITGGSFIGGSVTIVPEPSGSLLALLGLGVVMRRRRA